MTRFVRKCLLWMIGLPLLGILLCLETVGSVITGLGMILMKGISIVMIFASVAVVLTGVMPLGKDILITGIVAVVLFWLPECMAAGLAGVFMLQRVIWGLMKE